MEVSSGLLKRGKESQKAIIGFESAHRLARRGDLLECLFLESQVRLDVTMRGLNALVTQPQSDHCNIDSGLKQVQSTRMSTMSLGT